MVAISNLFKIRWKSEPFWRLKKALKNSNGGHHGFSRPCIPTSHHCRKVDSTDLYELTFVLWKFLLVFGEGVVLVTTITSKSWKLKLTILTAIITFKAKATLNYWNSFLCF